MQIDLNPASKPICAAHLGGDFAVREIHLKTIVVIYNSHSSLTWISLNSPTTVRR